MNSYENRPSERIILPEATGLFAQAMQYRTHYICHQSITFWNCLCCWGQPHSLRPILFTPLFWEGLAVLCNICGKFPLFIWGKDKIFDHKTTRKNTHTGRQTVLGGTPSPADLHTEIQVTDAPSPMVHTAALCYHLSDLWDKLSWTILVMMMMSHAAHSPSKLIQVSDESSQGEISKNLISGCTRGTDEGQFLPALSFP